MSVIDKVTVGGTTYDLRDTKAQNDCADLLSHFDLYGLREIESVNKYDDREKTINSYLNVSGAVVSSDTSFVTDFIPVKALNVVSLTVLNGSGEYKGTGAVNFMRIVWYDANKSAIGYSDYANKVPIAQDGYIRAALANSFLNFKLISITLDLLPANATEMSAYCSPYEAQKNAAYCDTSIIDCWGDSRIENGSAGTPMPTYLAQNLGYGYTVNNYGESSQTSGEVAMRFGSNEVYLTLEGNEIPATTDAVNVTGIVCSTGDRFGFANLYNLSGNKPVECVLCGVRGYLSATNVNSQKFTRATAGTAVTVPPCSRAWVDWNDTVNHVVLIWVGKNDQTSAGDPWYKKGVLSNIKGMVDTIKHDKYIILGDTNDTSDAQKIGTNWYTRIIGLNAELEMRYPNNFIDIRKKLILDGLTDAEITPTADDLAWIENGCIPTSLMADDTHPNDVCKKLIARYVYQFMQSKGWI